MARSWRGVGGRRNEYRPIESRLVNSAEPLLVARAFRERFGLNELYVADLDAILGQPPALLLFEQLHRDGFRLWVDAGLRCAADARILAEASVNVFVAGLETIRAPEELRLLCQEHGAERIVFSLDLKAGLCLGNSAAWPSADPVSVVESALAVGATRVLVLDLAQVGSASGTGTADLCHQLARSFPNVRLAAGGGIRGMEDVRFLADCSVETVLVASALHDQRITGADLGGGTSGA